jgi:hypothetical protein
VLKHPGIFLVLSAVAMMMSSHTSAADLRLPIEPAAAPRQQPQKSEKALFEEFLRFKRQQHR